MRKPKKFGTPDRVVPADAPLLVERDILVDLRAVFDIDSVAKKNIMLRRAHAEISRSRKPDPKRLTRAAQAAYERFVKEAGFEKDARIREWGKLSYIHQKRWLAIAEAVLAA